MKVKKYVAANMPEAMKMIRNELGNDAVILNSKVVHKGGIFGFFSKKKIEVIAAVDPAPVQKINNVQIEKQQQKQKKELIHSNPSTTKKEQQLLQEIQQVKALMMQLSRNTDQKNGEYFPDPIQEMNEFLMKQEVQYELRNDMITYMLEKWFKNEKKGDQKQVVQWGKEFVNEQFSHIPFGSIDYTKKYVNVVGPTGVGKTTTLAKIAANAVLKHEKKVAFITTDTYRIAAIDQLKTYAKILNVPLEVTYTIEDFIKAKDKFAHYDLILIDTAGRNFRNKKYIEDLKTVINFDEDLETFLVLALTAKYSDLSDIVHQFSHIHIHKLIFTKVDETASYGSMLNLIHKYQLGVAYLTNGQNVPDDMIEASLEVIANTIFEGKRT